MSQRPRDLAVPDDGQYKPKIGGWAEEKYGLLWCYADLFATSMKSKWDKLTYVDLFSGAGHVADTLLNVCRAWVTVACAHSKRSF